MSGALHALPAAGGLLAALTARVRDEFCGEMIRIDPDDPVFARGRCGVVGCDRGAWARGMCTAHYTRWSHHHKPDLDAFAATTGPIRERAGSERVDAFDLRAVSGQPRLEVAYVIQCHHDDRAVRLLSWTVGHLVGLLAETKAESLLDLPLDGWLKRIRDKGLVDPSRIIGLTRYAWRHLTDLAEGADPDSEFARDVWRAAVIGTPQARPPHQIRFDGITQPWLRAAVKRSARFRLGSGKAFGTVSIDERALRWFSQFLAERHPDVDGPAKLTRPVLEHYLSWLAAAGLRGHTTNTYLVCVRGFLDACHRHGWLPGLPAGAAVYLDELPRRPQPLPRFIPEFVMNQLEDPDRLSRLPDATTRHLLIVVIETGLRANDACALPFNPLIDDSVGWPCLRFFNAKMAAEQLVPLSQRAADAVRAQQAHLRQRWPEEPPSRLFPAPRSNPDGARPFNYATFRERLARWQQAIDLRDESGQPVHVTAHQFRHTLGTRLINAGVPQHIVQKLLGHASPQMTARYATIHDTTTRAAFDDYQRRRVDISGRRLHFEPDTPAADAEWVKHNLARVASSLPNGYCGRPPQQDCPHPNACLTCPDFQTTPQFLTIHRRQRDDTLQLLNAAERNGSERLAANHRQVHANLERVITALETIDSKEPIDAR